jgi:hypothetical protein
VSTSDGGCGQYNKLLASATSGTFREQLDAYQILINVSIAPKFYNLEELNGNLLGKFNGN